MRHIERDHAVDAGFLTGDEGGYNVPILLIMFNRPTMVRQVVNAVRIVRPAKLYLACDGPRKGSMSDLAKIEETRSVEAEIDWPCEVFKFYSDENWGCKYGPQRAIDWFFESESEGIILEDDCIPHPDFFNFCRQYLEKYRDDLRVWHINGNNFAADPFFYQGKEVQFVSLAQVWGWATWADRWEMGARNAYYLYDESQPAEWQLSFRARITKYFHLIYLLTGFDAWDYQWQISILNNRGLVVTPRNNLITNIGDGDGATHTARPDEERLHLPTEALDGEPAPGLQINVLLQDWYERKMGLRGGWKLIIKLGGKKLVALIKSWIKRLIVALLFHAEAPIVVASNGRAGSTMLTDAIALAVTRSRWRWLPSNLADKISRLSQAYVARLDGENDICSPVVKTHDLHRGPAIPNAKYIFVYGDPLESAMSAHKMAEKHGNIWLEQHIYHLCGCGAPYQLYQKDVLNYAGQIASWCAVEGALCIRYEEIWEKTPELEDFLGIQLQLPARQKRAVKTAPINLNHDLFCRLAELQDNV